MSWKKYKLTGLDANIFSYHFHKHPIFGPISKEIFDALSLNKLRAVTSIITLTEVFSVMAPLIKLKLLEKQFSETPNLVVIEVNNEVALAAAKLRREYGFRTPDAIQLATAVHAEARAFITNNSGLKTFKKIKIILLSETKEFEKIAGKKKS